MRIYAAADIHANVERIAHIRSVISEYSPDVLVLAGDVISYFRPRPVFEQFNAMGVPVLMVRGNSDPGYVDKYFQKFSNLTSLHLNRKTVQSISFAGLSGTIPLPFRNRIGWREKYLMDQVSPMIDSQTVFVVHTPPRGCLDQVAGRFHSGSKMVRELVDKTQPRLLICGHIHEAAGVDRIGETTVLNCGMPGTGKGMMIELTHGEKPVVEMV
ncbi:MAG: metallophosphoesterase family protein [Spirochaetales bacterium]|jgi:Icc-related predicted phosphoesterase|nr:metallophosphoesterase family protein [Spirochaetales bacterium]